MRRSPDITGGPTSCREAGGFRLLSALLLLGLLAPVGAEARQEPQRPGAPPDRIALVRVREPSRAQREAIARLGLETVAGPFDRQVTLFLTAEELTAVRALGLAPEVIEADAEAFFQSRLDASLGPGSMGGYYTLAEAEAVMDALATAHPDIVGAKFSLGTSIEGRDVWAFRVSDDPGTIHPERPAVYYNALIHAREPVGMMILFNFVEDLARKWEAGDPDVAYLLASRELWFVPVVNPDGYYYNEVITGGAGGGMWRKNKRDNNGDGQFTWGADGVDLNRNWGFHWGEDDIGSSPDPRRETYRGTAPFSEPETRAARDVVLARTFQFAINYHTHSNVYIHAFGFTSALPARIDEYRDWLARISRFNNFPYGTGEQMIGYYTNGDAVDWQYGDQDVLAIVPEIGSIWDYFWAPTVRIPTILREHLGPNHLTAWLAGGVLLVDAEQISEVSGNGDGYADAGETLDLHLKLTNAGITQGVSGAVGTLTPLGSEVTVQTGTVTLGDWGVGESRLMSEPFRFRVEATHSGRRLEFALRIQAAGGYTRTDTIGVFAGQPVVLLAEDWENRAADGSGVDWEAQHGWYHQGGFRRSNRYPYTGSYSATDAPGGTIAVDYGDLARLAPVDLSGYHGARLLFRSRRRIGPDNIALVTVGIDPFPWPGSDVPEDRAPLPYYTTGNLDDWEQVEIDLTPYVGTPQLYLRWLSLYASSDVGAVQGWSIDDIRLEAWTSARGEAVEASARIVVAGPYPNPTDPKYRPVWIDLDLSELAAGMTPVRIEVYDVRGRRVVTLVDAALETRHWEHAFSWDGTDTSGRDVASGIYLLRVTAAGKTVGRKIVVLR